MTCGLSDDELTVLHYFYGNRNFTPDTSKREEAIYRDLGEKVATLGEVLQGLMNKGYVGRKKKRSWNYWVQLGRAKGVLMAHGYSVGPRRHL